ncbi:hypothetical protein EDD11_008903 [Mortierella claussenii]|nr:hypothetical protein EDD11_008903 [Mortierella claussenii]
MKVILFRHGHSLANQESRIVSSLENGTRTTGGPEDTGFGLSQQGKQEVVEIRILTSPFQRTRQTAGIIDQVLRDTSISSKDKIVVMGQEQEPEQITGLRERFFGEFEMQTPSDDLYAKVWKEDAHNPFHELFGVESVAQVTKRMTEVIRDQETKERGQRKPPQLAETWIVVVSHGDSLQILQAAMRGWSGDRHRQIDHLNTANWRDVQWCEALAVAHTLD